MFNGVVVVVGRAWFISCAIQQLSKSIGCDFCDNFPIHRIQIKVNNFGKLCRSIPAVCVALVLFFFRMVALFQRMLFLLIESIYMDFTWIQFRFVFSFQDYDFVVGTVLLALSTLFAITKIYWLENWVNSIHAEYLFPCRDAEKKQQKKIWYKSKWHY